MEEMLEVIRVELKYCEACGALRLRDPESAAPYCRSCEKLMSELAHRGAGRCQEGRLP